MTQTLSSKPNIIWIFGDQHRAQALSHMGDPNARTPRLDALARESTSFRNAVAGCPWCTPFRGALLTGQYNHRSLQRTPQRLDPSLPLVTDAFNDAGYYTAYFGKWHLDGHNEMTYVPRERRGRFQTWIGYENNNAQYETCVHGHDVDGRNDTEPLVEPLVDYETDALTDRFIRCLEKRPPGKPFFSVLSVQPPHDPHVAPPEYEKNYRPEDIQLRPNVPPVERIRERSRTHLAGYYAQIENLDANVGRVLDYLKESGLDQNTWVFFFSDHGDMHGSHGYRLKSSPWEEAIRIPMIIRPPTGHVAPRTSPEPVNHVDISATTLGICGIPQMPSTQGTDWSHVFFPERTPPPDLPRSAFLQHVFRKRFQCLNRVWRGIRTVDGWKYIVLEHQPFAMFNLNEDPYELNNLAFLDDHNDDRERLQAELAAWIEKTGDSFALPEL